MQVELVKTTTRDGVRLDGVYQRAAGDLTVLCLHGAGSNFYSGGLFEHLTPRLLESGAAVLRVNTRGHDGYYAGRWAGGARRFGAAYETVADCQLDLAGWLDWLEQHGAPRVVLLGHSLGAIKAVYSEAMQPDARVTGVLALSPPRLSCAAFQWGEQSAKFGALLREAQDHVQRGRGSAIIESTFPFPMLITADAFLDKYGGERYNVVELTKRLTTPAIYAFGQLELEQGGIAFAGVPEAIMAARQPNQALETHVIEGADHFYIGCYDALTHRVLDALSRLQ